MEDKDVAMVYETLLCTPGMNQQVKIELRINRKTVLLLSQVIYKGLNSKSSEGYGMPDIANKEAMQELEDFVEVSLEKAELSALSILLQKIQNKEIQK